MSETPETSAAGGDGDEDEPAGVGRSTAFFSIATGASRIAGLVREIVAASYFGVTGPMSAFTIAFLVPNLIRMLFADAALQAAFVPVFTEQLEEGNRPAAFRLASTLLFLVTVVLGLITAVFILLAPVLMPLFVPGSRGRDPRPDDRALAAPVPDPGHARDLRRRRRRPQQLQPLRRLRDRAALLERRDHRRPRRARAGVPRGGSDLRLRDRGPGRHRDPAGDGRLRPPQHPVPARAGVRVAQRRWSRRC